MTDEELLSLAPDTLTESAQEALHNEVSKRELIIGFNEEKKAISPTPPGPNSLLMEKPVGGWLAFLCFNMIVGPVFGLIQLAVGNEAISKSPLDQIPRLRTLVVVHDILCVLLFVMLSYTGVILWRKGTHALQIAKIVLLANLGYALFVPFYPLLMDLPTEMSDRLVRSLAKTLVPSYIWLVGWLLYLRMSRRVNATFQRSH
jgi:hypothetical protein